MPGTVATPDAEGPGPGRGWPSGRDLALAAIVYAAAAVAATYPAVTRLATALPSIADPVQHLWVMRWYKTCLLEGRLPFFCPDVQYPAGAPLANFSPMHLQAALYLPLSVLTSNDVLIYNLLWFGGFVSTGLGTFVLAWTVLRRRAPALLAGLLAMLSTPVMIHSIGHLELIYLGALPLFLACWLRFVDAPGWGRLLAAVGSYLLTATAAAYYGLLVIAPAALYAAMALSRRGGAGGEVIGRARRLGWLAGFAALVLPFLPILFGAQVWATTHGISLERSRIEFEADGSPWWSYVTPTIFHPLGRLLPFPVHLEAGLGDQMLECASYLGVVTLVLMHRAAWRRGALPRAGFWWLGLGLMVVLSFGAHATLGERALSLPASWLWSAFPPFRLIRMPVRFNLLAVVFAAVLAGAGFRDLIAGLRTRAARGAVVAVAAILATADLAFMPYIGHVAPPALPPAYAQVLARDPGAAFLEAPTAVSGECDAVSALGCYWQSLHGGRTTAGYSGLANPRFDDRVYQGSPFALPRLADPGYLANPESETFGLISGAPFDDYAWLFLRANGLRYVALHDHGGAFSRPIHADRLMARLAPAQVARGDGVRIYDRERMPRPRRPVVVCLDGWRRRTGWRQPRPCLLGPTAGLAVYAPRAGQAAVFRLEAQAIGRPRTVRLVGDGRELARWRIEPDAVREYATPPLSLPAGYREWTVAVESDGGPGRHPRDDARRLVRVRGLRLDPSGEEAPPTLATARPPDAPAR